MLGFPTYPGNLSIQKSMKHTFVGQDRVASDAIEEGLEHSLSSSDHDGILLGFTLLDRVITDRVLGRYWGDYESRVEFDEVSSEGLELGIAVTGFMVLDQEAQQVVWRVWGGGDTYACSDNVGNIRRVGSHRRLLRVDDLPWR